MDPWSCWVGAISSKRAFCVGHLARRPVAAAANYLAAGHRLSSPTLRPTPLLPPLLPRRRSLPLVPDATPHAEPLPLRRRRLSPTRRPTPRLFPRDADVRPRCDAPPCTAGDRPRSHAASKDDSYLESYISTIGVDFQLTLQGDK